MKRYLFNKKELLCFGVALFISSLMSVTAQERTENFSFQAYEALNLPSLDSLNLNACKKVRIAVIDDGFNLNHELLQAFIGTNPNEIPYNNLDDDNNGYVDDVVSWDVADNNNDVELPVGREREFYHGTMVASIITTTFIETFDTLANQYVEILPIKAVSNGDPRSYVKDGYKGIEYALTRDVDIICCAWSGGEMTKDQIQIINKAYAMGVIVVGSAGNHYNHVLQPASLPTVVAVSAVDSNQKLVLNANTGKEIDFVASGDAVRAGHPLDVKAFFYGSGTSASVALVSACYGIVKANHNDETQNSISDALMYTANSTNPKNLKYNGRMGAGIPNVSNAIRYLDSPKLFASEFNSSLSKGLIYFSPKSGEQQYTVKPIGSIYGIEFEVECPAKGNKKDQLEFSGKDTTFTLRGDDPLLCQKQIVKGNYLTVTNKNPKNKKPILVRYQVSVLDSSSLYCSETKYIYKPGIELTDGSGPYNYSNKCDCKWVIQAPPGKKIQLDFTELDTQGNLDFVWIFEGRKTLETNLIAKFSGNSKPPVLTSSSNEVMLWFLSDGSVTGQGWKVKYTWVD